MDYRAVLILLCMLCTQAPCRPAGSGAAEEPSTAAIKLLLELIRTALKHLDDVKLSSDYDCSKYSADRLSSVRCYTQKLSREIPELPSQLLVIAQITQDIELLSSSFTTQNCSLPAFEQELKAYEFAKCFLQRVEKELFS